MPIKHIVFTGPESSGKSYLSKICSTSFQLPLVEEYARAYLNENGLEYTFQDLLAISAYYFNFIENTDDQFVTIFDTNLLTLKIWAQEVFNKRIPRMDKFLLETKDFTYYLLCKPDIPWEFDPMRENPTDRDKLFLSYLNVLQDLKLHYTIIEGDFEDRIIAAKNNIGEVLSY